MVRRDHSPWTRRRIQRLSSALTPLFLVLGFLFGPGLLASHGAFELPHPLALQQVPGPSPRQTVDHFLSSTDQAHQLIHGAIEQGLAEPGWFFSNKVRRQADQGQQLLDQATEALNLSQLPEALRPITGGGYMLQLRSLLLYNLANHPGLVLPGPEEVARQHIRSWSIPETSISLQLNQPPSSPSKGADSADLPCGQCSEQDFLFSPHTLAQVDADFNRIFGRDTTLRRRFGGDLYVNWSLLPGDALPPKWILSLPRPWREVVVEHAYGGQSLVQWLIVLPVSVLAVIAAVTLLMVLRYQLKLPTKGLGGAPYWQRAGLLVPVLALVPLWRWFCIDWVNLTAGRALAVLVVAEILQTALAMPLLYALFEALGQSLSSQRQRQADGTVCWMRRKGAGQLLTITRVLGLVAAVTVLIQGARSLGLTSVTILALSSVPALAISLGTQQLIRDISDGFSLFLDKQIKVGDRCTIGTAKSGQIDGTVVSMGMRSIALLLKNGSLLSIPNSQVAGSVVTNHSFRSAEPLDLQLPLPKLQTQAISTLQQQAQALLTATNDLIHAEAHLDHGSGDWWLHVRGKWSSELPSDQLSVRRDALLLALHGLVSRLDPDSNDG